MRCEAPRYRRDRETPRRSTTARPRAQSSHLGAHLASDLPVLGHVRTYHDGIRAGFQRLEHRHGRTHAVEPRELTAGENNPADAAADDDWAIGQLRLVALLDRRVEGVAIDRVSSSRCARSRGDPQLSHLPWAVVVAPISPQSRHSALMALPPVATTKPRRALRWSPHGPEVGAE